ncbi:MAG: DNA replication and repair protein RecF [Pseudomonadota bacterium]
MSIVSISIQNFKLLRDVKLKFCSGINIFYGLNGSGKTSLLEVLFFLSRGKSFKQNISNRLITIGSDQFIIFGLISQNSHIGISKSLSENLRIKYDNKFILSSFILSKSIILQILNPDSYLLIDSGPSIRRKFMDWLVFHVKHNLYIQWKRYRLIIKNRNKALKSKLSKSEIRIWDHELTQLTNLLSENRQNYIDILNLKLKIYKNKYLFNFDICIEYYPGWNIKDSYTSILDNNFNKDFKFGFTQYGLHKADFILKININNNFYLLKDYLSNGQKKYIAMFIYILQMIIYKENIDEYFIKPLLLIDDITSELDTLHSDLLLSLIAELDLQIFFTLLQTTENMQLISQFKNSQKLKKEVKLFHVKHGEINEQSNKKEV